MPPGTQPGTVLGIPGSGLPHWEAGAGRTGARGDLRVTVAVRIPACPQAQERELYERLRALAGASRPQRSGDGRRPEAAPAPHGKRWWPWRRRRRDGRHDGATDART
ncbi:hypothetical protein [Streptomyces sp. SP17BM10]|uniref:hypothetical protein n=1 Tax=Streptomyces sp. SP17BM10 TaxID=3002530 RepID=UPI003FCCC725